MQVRSTPVVRALRAALILAAAGLPLLALAPGGGSPVTPAAAQAAADCTLPDVMPTSDVQPGMTGTGYTVIDGRTVHPFEVDILGVLPDGIAPGLDFIMVSVPEGIAAGYSGSPVYVGGKLVGAVSYGLPSDDGTIGGLTPAGPMLDVLGYPSASSSLARAASTTKTVRLTPRLRMAAARASGSPLATVPQTARHLPVALAVSGLDDRAMARLEGVLSRNGIQAVTFRAGAAAVPDTVSDQPLERGSSFAAAASYGDLTYAGIGTTTVTCGARMVAWGHPFEFTGATSLALGAADVLTVVRGSDSYKVANLGELHGVVDQDRLAGLRGIAGAEPDLVPVTATVTNADLDRMRTGTTTIASQDNVPFLAAFHLLGDEDTVFDRLGDGGVDLTFTVHGTRADGRPFTLVRHNAYYSSYDATEPTIGELAGYLNQIVSNPFEKVHVDSVDIQGTISQQARPQKITRVLSSSSLAPVLKSRSLLPARRGSLIHLRVYLQPQVAVGQPAAPEHAVDMTVRVPQRGLLGLLTVTGGRPSFSCAFCIGDETGVPYSGLKSFDGLLGRLNAKPRHSDLVASLRMFPSRQQASVKSSQHAVITGGKAIRILAQ
jgi:hypothetical protein